MHANIRIARRKRGAFQHMGNVYIPNLHDEMPFGGLTEINSYIKVTPDGCSYTIFPIEIHLPGGYAKRSEEDTLIRLHACAESTNPTFCLDLTRVIPRRVKKRLLTFFSALREISFMKSGSLSSREAYILCHAISPGWLPYSVRIQGTNILIGYKDEIYHAIGKSGENIRTFQRALKKLGEINIFVELVTLSRPNNLENELSVEEKSLIGKYRDKRTIR